MSRRPAASSPRRDASVTGVALRRGSVAVWRLGLLLAGSLGRRRGVRDVRQHLRVVRQVVAVPGWQLLGVALRADADGLALALRRRDGDLDLGLLAVLVLAVDLDGRAGLHVARAQHLVGERILDVALDRTAERTGSHRGIPTLLDQQVARVVGQRQ